MQKVGEEGTRSHTKVTIVGVGQVGMACAYSIMQQVISAKHQARSQGLYSRAPEGGRSRHWKRNVRSRSRRQKSERTPDRRLLESRLPKHFLSPKIRSTFLLSFLSSFLLFSLSFFSFLLSFCLSFSFSCFLLLISFFLPRSRHFDAIYKVIVHMNHGY